ncbi:hypothetical protein Q7P37_007392 [Cladosporium fusiforme]
MAPTKKDEKEAKLTPEQSAAVVLDYLRKQNRPYSATDISTNLKNRVTKAAAAKLLKDMHERNEIEGRAAGKQLVYHAIQEEADESSLEALQEMDAETSRLKDNTAQLKAEEKVLRATLRDHASLMPLPELKTSVATLQYEKEAMCARLAKLKDGDVKPITPEERARVNAEHEKWQGCIGSRRKIRLEMWKMIEELISDKEKAAETKERLGLEALM